jgi:hypothetical protein
MLVAIVLHAYEASGFKNFKNGRKKMENTIGTESTFMQKRHITK